MAKRKRSAMPGKTSSSQTLSCDCSKKTKVPQIKHYKDSDDFCVISNDRKPECFNNKSESKTSAQLWTLWNERRDRPELCDVTLTVGDRHLHVHKVVLMENIPYFKTMFESEMIEAKLDKVDIKDIDFDCVEMIIDYVYGQEIKITGEFFLDLAVAADFYQVPNLTEKCMNAFPQVFTEDFNVNDLLPIHSFCQLIDLTKYIDPIEDAIKDNFEAVSMHPDFPKLPFETILKSCKADALTVKDEEVVLQAICRWLNGNLDRDFSDMRKLLACVRLPLLEISTLTSLNCSKELKYYEAIQKMIEHKINEKQNKKYSTNFKKGAREPVGTTIIFPIDLYASSNNNFALYSFCNGHWTKSIFHLIGSYIEFACVSGQQVCWYERHTHQFAYRSFTSSSLKIHQKDINYIPAQFDRFILKGYNKPKAFSNGKSWIFGNVHKDILTLWKGDSWLGTIIKGIKNGAVLVFLDDAIYIIGGSSDSSERDAFHDVLMVKEEEISVKREIQPVPVAPMICGRTSTKAVAFKGKIYVCRGYSSDRYEKSAEVYDPQKNEWKLFPPPSGEDIDLSATKTNLYAQSRVGNAYMRTILERFDEIEERWEDVSFD